MRLVFLRGMTMPYSLFRFSLLLLCLITGPFGAATAQSALVFEPEAMVLVEDTELIVTNRLDDAVRVDSIKFSEYSFAAWSVDVHIADTMYYPEMYFSLGRYLSWGPVPFPTDMLIASNNRMTIDIQHYDPCVVCKSSCRLP